MTSGAANANPGDADVVVPASKRKSVLGTLLLGVILIFFSFGSSWGDFFSAIRGDGCGNIPRRHPLCSLSAYAYGGIYSSRRFSCPPSLRALFVYKYCDMSGDAASFAIAAAAGEVPIAAIPGASSGSIPGMAQAQMSSPQGSSVVTTASLNVPGAPSHFIQLSAEAISEAPSMDPSLEAVLRSVNLCEQLITAFRVQEITDRELFVALDTSEETLRETCKEAFGIDASKGFAHKRELGKIIKAWNNAKVHSDTKLKLDAVARSHGEPVSMLCADWEALMLTFNTKFGSHLPDTVLPAQSYFEGFEERLANGQLRAELLTQVVSVREQEEQESRKPDSQRHMSLHLDGQLTIQTKRRYLSSMPANPEELRVKYKIMTHCCLLAQMRQPGRHLYADFTHMTFIDFLDELLSERNFLMDKVIGLWVWVTNWNSVARQSNTPENWVWRSKKLYGHIATITTVWRTSPTFCTSPARLRLWTRTNRFSSSRKKWLTWKDRCALGRPVVAHSSLPSQLQLDHLLTSLLFLLHRHPKRKPKAKVRGRAKARARTSTSTTRPLSRSSLSSSSWTCPKSLVQSSFKFQQAPKGYALHFRRKSATTPQPTAHLRGLWQCYSIR